MKKNKKILVIVGPTATGKTSLGIKLCKEFNGEIVSSDSRQVYKYMDIGTGKEWGEVKIWGYDLVEPWENFSVSEYFKRMKWVVEDIWKRGKLPVIVGGTGFYVKSLIDGIQTVDIPKNINLRNSLESLSVSDLFEKLAVLDGTKAASLNSSDKLNPRRLIRAIEVASWKIENETKNVEVIRRENVLNDKISVLQIGLIASLDSLKLRIKKRVEKRMNEGFIDEIENLLKMGISWKNQSMQSLGYKESEDFFKNGTTYEDFISNWESNEINYIKRQITWFKKDKRIVWFDIESENFYNEVEKEISKWYSTNEIK
jgi:tRNA dimethylallyltransferase